MISPAAPEIQSDVPEYSVGLPDYPITKSPARNTRRACRASARRYLARNRDATRSRGKTDCRLFRAAPNESRSWLSCGRGEVTTALVLSVSGSPRCSSPKTSPGKHLEETPRLNATPPKAAERLSREIPARRSAKWRRARDIFVPSPQSHDLSANPVFIGHEANYSFAVTANQPMLRGHAPPDHHLRARTSPTKTTLSCIHVYAPVCIHIHIHTLRHTWMYR